MAQKLAITITLMMSVVSAAAIPEEPVSAFIVGGELARPGEFPYIVSLSNGKSQFCGGALLNANTVLTAAHCSQDEKASAVRVRAGSLTWASGGTSVGVSSIFIHPNYDSNTTDNDVALWNLSTPIQASSTIGYAKLPEPESDPTPDSIATIAGWGDLASGDDSPPPAELRKVSVPVVSRETCRADLEHYGDVVTDNMFCAGLKEGGKDSCQGDSGGPIVDQATGALIGLVSWGEGCARASSPGVYVRLGNFVRFIADHM
ncbi:Trypsin [Purpureocillium takamizusanense]|uniref:Trypsin n=1 Tax=Purpureocillium takamizusanense TaxID=2060973 RepID=A0A9Q8QSU0_9HYPO|nr:Trypsin [Purpureocillium takamizusanense]UNI24641.1 Trypsin [Purpureocillium takamizusanense]